MKKKLLTLGILAAAWLIFWLISKDTLDPDFGWHIRMGEIIVKTGIPVTDPFSYTMPDYPYVDFGWLTNVIWYLAYPFLGLSGLTFIYAGLAVCSVWIAVPRRYKKWCWLPVLLGWSVMFSRFSLREQIVSWFFWAFTLRMLSEERTWNRWKWFFPLVMLIWANLHGSFFLGLVASWIWYAADVIRSRRIHAVNLFIFISGSLITLINPYGFGLWREVAIQVGHSGLFMWTISEWLPFYFRVDMGFLMTIVMLYIFGVKYRFRLDSWKWIILGWIFLSGLSSLRHVPIFLIAAAGPVSGILSALEHKTTQTDKSGKSRFIYFYRLLVAVGLLIFAGEAIVVGIERLTVFRRESFYPVYAVDFLKTNSTPDRIFSMYEWGGYLIWQLPEKKVFIDGRMLPYMSKTKTDQEYLFKEYLQATQKREVLTDLLDRYSVNKVLWANTGNYRKSGFGDWIAKTFFPSLVNNAVKGGVVDWLTDSGWQKQYEDDVAVILFRTVDK